MLELHKIKKQYYSKGDILTKKREYHGISWDIEDKNGEWKCGGWYPMIWSKYASRIRMKFKKVHDPYCQCYWCRKKRYRTERHRETLTQHQERA